jgi:hypothetical protein
MYQNYYVRREEIWNIQICKLSQYDIRKGILLESEFCITGK